MPKQRLFKVLDLQHISKIMVITIGPTTTDGMLVVSPLLIHPLSYIGGGRRLDISYLSNAVD